jgi:hypothetical protein
MSEILHVVGHCLSSHHHNLDNLASAASNKKTILEQLITSNSSLATSNSNLTSHVKTFHDQLTAKSRDGGKRGAGSNDPNKRREPDPDGYCWSHGYRVGHGHTGHTCSNPKEVASPPPHTTTSWAALLPTRTRCPTGAPEAPGRTYKQKLSLLRPLIF